MTLVHVGSSLPRSVVRDELHEIGDLTIFIVQRISCDGVVDVAA
jgi:hypothetical protein